MKYEKGKVQVYAGHVDDILNAGLRVLFFDESAGPGEGEAFTLEEVSRGEPTGRKFFARVMHAIDPQVVQFNLEPFMEDVNSETGKPERMPMAGEFANEKAIMPGLLAEGATGEWDLRVPGQKPLWAYKGVKWVGEYSLVGYLFPSESILLMREGKPGIPRELKLKIQGQGGEYEAAYVLK